MVNHFRTAVEWYNKISYRDSDWWCIAYDWAYFVLQVQHTLTKQQCCSTRTWASSLWMSESFSLRDWDCGALQCLSGRAVSLRWIVNYWHALILPDAEVLGRDLLVWRLYVCAPDKHVRQHTPTYSRYDEMHFWTVWHEAWKPNQMCRQRNVFGRGDRKSVRKRSRKEGVSRILTNSGVFPVSDTHPLWISACKSEVCCYCYK